VGSLSSVRRLIVALLLCVCAAAHAGVVNPRGGMGLSYGSGSVTMGDGFAFERFMGRTLTGNGINGGVNLVERYGMQVGGQNILVNAARVLSAAEIAAAAAALGGAAWAGMQIGAPISKALGNDTVTLGPVRCVATYSGWQCDAGVAPEPPTTVAGWQGDSGGETCKKESALAAIKCAIQEQNHVSAGELSGCVIGTQTATAAQGGCYYTPTGTFLNATASPAQVQRPAACPASVDALNPAYSVPAGGQPGPDGKCQSGRYNGTAPEAVADRLKLYGNPSNDPTTWPGVATDTLDKGGPITTGSPRSLTGPPSAVGQPTTGTITRPDGSTATRTTTPTINYYYAGDTITYNEYNTTTTTGPEGTTTETEEKPPEKTECEQHPDTLGCSKYGEPGTDKPGWGSQTITFTPEDLGFGGACPAPETWTVHNWHWSISYQPLCDVAPTIKTGLLALAAFAAIALIIKGAQ